jgi:hypothetical protein
VALDLARIFFAHGGEETVKEDRLGSQQVFQPLCFQRRTFLDLLD